MEGYTDRTDSLCHTMLSAHQDELEQKSFRERVFSRLSGAMYPVFSDVFLLDIRLRN